MEPTRRKGEAGLQKAGLQMKIKEQEILQYELSSLQAKAKVYRQQQNSNILFLSGMQQEMQCAKKNLDSLLKEYQQLEAASPEEGHPENLEKEDAS